MPGRKPKPTHLKILEGNPGKQRLPKGVPVPVSDLPAPADFLDDYGMDEWARLSAGLHSLGILYEVDVAVFAAYCAFASQVRAAEELKNELIAKGGKAAGLLIKTANGTIMQHPIIGVLNTARLNMLRCAVEFGLTPSARAKLAIDPGGQKKSKFEGLINGGKK